MSTNILDKITTNAGEEYSGVIDYVTAKYVSFFDTTDNNDPVITKILILYKSYYSHMRFSIFKAMYFPMQEMRPLVINRKTITESTKEIETSIHNKRTFKITKKN